MFPFTMKYKHQIECVLDNNIKGRIFDLLTKELTLKNIDYMFIDKDQIDFHKKLFKLIPNWHLMSIVDGGYFKLMKLKEKVFLVYQIKFYRLLVFSILAGLIFAGIDQNIYLGLIAFGVLFFLNVIISLILHLDFFTRLISKIRKDIL